MKLFYLILACCFCVTSFIYSHENRIFDAGGNYHAIPHKIVEVHSVSDIQDAILEAKQLGKKITIGGYRHSQAGHTILDDSIHLDMKQYNKVISIDLENRTVTVESGISWETLLIYLTQFQMSPKIMQDLSTFTVGGSMGSNILGRNPNAPPLINSIVSFTFMDAKGDIRVISREENQELFSLIIGGYGLFGIVLEVKLEIIPNVALEGIDQIIPVEDYSIYLNKLRTNPRVVFHSGYLDEKNENVVVKNYFSLNRIANESDVISRNIILSRKPVMKYWVQDNSNNLISFAIPAHLFKTFVDQATKEVQASDLKVLRITTKHILQDTESALPLIKEDSVVVAFIFNLTLESHEAASYLRKQLTKEALKLSGNVYLTFSHEIDQTQMKVFYPSLDYFLMKKREYDPEELFSSQFFENLK